ncbi:hypothetical protein CAPTEDRAFT_206073 [Capitella teleta]|uniref:VWFA domain-containing protein n=1 Tax=Capitella teleta TaxID=283909 RepID=R7UW75_CAPTE|nr:hypothetical protein CAPTEDRAFT_206073 [Capitella teleta]|eukprot:ELU08187.1 hypothetical protein CAPTEDRAFT_206073 [Capitella teleta]
MMIQQKYVSWRKISLTLYSIVFRRSKSVYFTKNIRQRFYFGEVTVLIPKTWSAKSSYGDVQQESSDTKDVFIEPKTNNKASNAPYTTQFKGCGIMGEFIHLTDAFLTDEAEAEKYGPRGKVLVHEWGHYRFGLYDEYPLSDKERFYRSSSGSIEATRCSLEIDGELYNSETGNSGCKIVDGLPEKACRFRAKSEKKSNYGSLMYKQNLEQITEFCTDDATKETLHNKEAPNNQNIQCNGRSAWEVIREHEDYKNSDTATIKDTTPKFKFVRKQSPPKVVLVLDVSGSMNSEGRLIKLRQGCYTLVRFVLSECSEVGIVLFNETAIISRPMTRVPRDPTAREDLANDLPRYAAGGTSIGAGINKALDMLGGDAEGSHLIVASDGEETEEPKIPNVTQRVLNSKVTVHSMAITEAAEFEMDGLSKSTNGKTYQFGPKDKMSYFSALRAFGESVEESCYKEKSNALVDNKTEGSVGKPSVQHFILDASLGRDLLIIIEFEHKEFEVKVSSPSGTSFNKRTSEEFWCNDNFKTCQFLMAKAEPGEWTFEITTRDRKQTFNYIVEAKSAESTEAIEAKTEWKSGGKQNILGDNKEPQKVYASVRQGSSPVLNGSVSAKISRPNATDLDVELKDDGVGADSFANDGIYSANFVGFTKAGRYSVQATIEGDENTATNTEAIIGIGGSEENKSGLKSTGKFIRSALGQTFQVVSYVPGPGGKNYSPDRIKDLIVREYDQELFTVTLEWTAVGEQADVGTASEYELRYGLNGADIQKNFLNMTLVSNEMIINGADLKDPRPSGQREVFKIDLPSAPDYYSFGVIAIDKKMRYSKSEISNVAGVSFKIHTTPTTTVASTTTPEPSDQSYITYIIIGCAALLFVALLSACIFGIIKCRPSARVDPTEHPEKPNYEEEHIYANSLPTPTVEHDQKRNYNGVKVMV